MTDTYTLPVVVAVTGHRDLRPDQTDAIRDRVRALFSEFRDRYPQRRLQVLSALAEGADRLVAEVALGSGVELLAVLPMPGEAYVTDFVDASSREEFESLCRAASEVFELPLAPGVTIEGLAEGDSDRDRQYARLGIYMSAHCHVLLALWDGKPSQKVGGTSQVVKFHHDDIMLGVTHKTVATQQVLIDDESDLVYHIVCSRDRDGGEPAEDLRPLDAFWFTKDREKPRSTNLPAQHRLIFRRGNEFAADAARFAEAIEHDRSSLLEAAGEIDLPPAISDIDRLFGMADWLAIRYQAKTLLGLRLSHLLALLMGFMFLLYSELESVRAFMVAFLAFFAGAAGMQYVATRRSWHRKYLDYRTLAEGLRVQFYWAAAGVTNENESKFSHDNFLQTQDPELGWIRNVMRVAGLRCDAAPRQSPGGLRFVLEEWIGDRQSGQLGYFRSKAKQWIRHNRMTELLARLSLLTSAGVVVAMLIAGSRLSESNVNVLMVAMGAALLLFGVRQAYAHSVAEKELIKQYEFMLRIFDNARRRMERAVDDAERRQILTALGGSALDEHAQWILMHRDRSPDQAEIWRIGN